MSKIIPVITKHPNFVRELRAVLPHVKFIEFSKVNLEQLKDSEIIIGDCNILAPHLHSLSESTKWVQTTWAGVDPIIPYVDKDKPFSFIISRFSGDHFGRLMSEHVVASMVNYERDMYRVWNNQKVKAFDRDGTIANYRCIADLTVGIMGVGHIGSVVGKYLSSFGATVIGLGRRESLGEDCATSFWNGYYTSTELDEFLPRCDYVINVLPSTPETRGMLDLENLQLCEARKAVFINIGRGTIVTEDHLVEALDRGYLSAALLDVFETEPLPASSKYWSHSKVHITPHVAGMTRARDFAAQFKDNMEKYQKGETISTTIGFDRNY